MAEKITPIENGKIVPPQPTDHNPNILISQQQIAPGTIKERHLLAVPTIANGDMIYGDGGNNWKQLGIGNSRQIMGTSFDSNGNVIPAWANPPGYSVKAWSGSAFPSASSTYYFGSLDGIWTTANKVSIVIPKDGYITATTVFVETDGTLSSTEKSTFTLTATGVSQFTIDSLVDTSTAVYSSYQRYSYGTYYYYFASAIEVKWTTPAWTTVPTYVRASVLIYIQ